LLEFLYPHFLAPIPSMALMQLDADPSRVQIPKGFTVAQGSMIDAATEPVACKFRIAYPVTLWPIRVNSASFRTPPFPPGLQPPAGTVAAVRLELECVGELDFTKLQLESLRFFLHGDATVVPELYEAILNHALQVVFVPEKSTTAKPSVSLPPDTCLHSVGFERDQGLLPYQPNSRMGYRLLTEFFTFPAKFQFFDLKGWPRLARAGFGRKCDVFIFCRKTHKALEQGVDGGTFRLGCTPAVNLFTKTVEPIALRPRQPSYRVLVDRMAPQAHEVYSVTKVASSDPATNRITTYPAFYGLEHTQGTRGGRIFWLTTRRRSLEENDGGTEVDLALVNLHFESRWPADEFLDVEILCMNRDLPQRIASARPPTDWALELPAPCKVHCLRMPTPPLRPAARTGGAWELISQLLLSPMSLTEGAPGRAALRDILRLYDFSDPAAGQKHLKDQALQIVDGVLDVDYRRVLGRVPSDPGRGLCRGLEVTLGLDPTKFPHRGAFLFGAVFDRFLGLYASSNAFTELIVKTPDGILKKWPARTGEIPLL
jgi:type VI secretion system protein ImpG